MKISYRWLEAFIESENEFLQPSDLATLLTRRGFEVDNYTQAPPCKDIIIGKIITTTPHPNAKRLSVCSVETGNGEVSIVCGAPNVRAGLTVAVALPGATVNDTILDSRPIRDVPSEGMLCSAAELAIGDDADSILELHGGKSGDSLESYLPNIINDTMLEVGITPNRGDCLSHLGLAREIAAAGCGTLKSPFGDFVADTDETFSAVIDKPKACPMYSSIIVRNVNNAVATPTNLLSRITRCGWRGVNLAVDATNYVLLQTGQPLHAFDLDKLQGNIIIRYAKDGEEITLLDGKTVRCDTDTLVIADATKAVAIAGVMGGIDTGVDENTKNILLEGAFFTPQAVRGKAQRYHLNSDAAFHFERGVDYRLAPAALQLAAVLIKNICGGSCGPVNSVGAEPPSKKIQVQGGFIRDTLGMAEIKNDDVVRLLADMAVPGACDNDEITVSPPSWRFDLHLPVDIVEEVVRAWGYDKITETMPAGGRHLPPAPPETYTADMSRRFFSSRGFYEIISYSFVSPDWEENTNGDGAIRLDNPISQDMSVMRRSLLGGLMNCARFNLNHKQDTIRLFEIGRCFFPATKSGDLPQQPQHLAGLLYGPAKPNQWGEERRNIDFYDIKGILESFLGRTAAQMKPISSTSPNPEQSSNVILHPEKSMQILLDNKPLGILGEVHPRLALHWGFRRSPLFFELDLEALCAHQDRTTVTAVSRFPMVSRDLAIIAPEGVTAADLLAAARQVTKPVSAVDLFDFYVGDNIPLGKKSFGIRITMQGEKQNLKDEDINQTLDKITAALAAAGGVKRDF